MDIFLRDRLTGQTTRLSVSRPGRKAMATVPNDVTTGRALPR